MQIRAEEISQIIQKQIEGFDASVELAETGTRVEVTVGNGRAGAIVSALPFVDCE